MKKRVIIVIFCTTLFIFLLCYMFYKEVFVNSRFGPYKKYVGENIYIESFLQDNNSRIIRGKIESLKEFSIDLVTGFTVYDFSDRESIIRGQVFPNVYIVQYKVDELLYTKLKDTYTSKPISYNFPNQGELFVLYEEKDGDGQIFHAIGIGKANSIIHVFCCYKKFSKKTTTAVFKTILQSIEDINWADMEGYDRQ